MMFQELRLYGNNSQNINCTMKEWCTTRSLIFSVWKSLYEQIVFFSADLQSDAFRDDTPTLPPSSAPAFDWHYLWILTTSEEQVRKHPNMNYGNNYDKTQQLLL